MATKATVCNLPNQPPPRIFKGHRDMNACTCWAVSFQKTVLHLASFRRDLRAARLRRGLLRDDCLAGEVKSRQVHPARTLEGGVSRAPEKTDEIARARAATQVAPIALQCGLHEFCCGEVGSPTKNRPHALM